MLINKEGACHTARQIEAVRRRAHGILKNLTKNAPKNRLKSP